MIKKCETDFVGIYTTRILWILQIHKWFDHIGHGDVKDLPKVKMPAHQLKPRPSMASLRINICTSWAGSHPLKWHRLSQKKSIWGYVENLGKMMQTLGEKLLKYFVSLQWTRVWNYCQGSRVSGKDWKNKCWSHAIKQQVTNTETESKVQTKMLVAPVTDRKV